MSATKERVSTVTHVTITPKVGKTTYDIYAKGKVPSLSWTQPEIKPVMYIHPPPDGIYDFTFVAVPPSGLAGSQMTDIEATLHDWPCTDPNFQGVRILAANNDMEKRL